MKRLTTTTLLAATALGFAMPATASAQAYQDCESERQSRQVTGAIIGGLLGAVIGNELADDSNNNRHGRDRYHDRDYRYDRYGRHGSRHYRRDRYEHRDRGNAEEVGTIAGAGVGALIGAGIAGGEDCDTQRYRRNDPYQGKPPGTYGERGQYGDSGYYRESGYDYGYEQGSNAGYAQYQDGEPYVVEDPSWADSSGYSGYDNSDVLLGGPSDGSARAYQASTSGYSASGYTSTGSCQWTRTRRMNAYGQPVTDQVYMCQGTDGIWRPADTYGR